MTRDAHTSRIDLYAAIRRDAKAGLSKRALQRAHGVGYRTVAAAVESAWPKEPKPPPKRSSRLDRFREVIDGWLRDDLDGAVAKLGQGRKAYPQDISCPCSGVLKLSRRPG